MDFLKSLAIAASGLKAQAGRALRLDRPAAHRLEGAETDVQRQAGDARATRLDAFQKRSIEMQAGPLASCTGVSACSMK